MKLSDYAKKVGISYRTAWRWWKQGNLTGYQLPSGTIIITDEDNSKSDLIACIYARVSSAENKDNLDRQAERLKDYAIARGYQIYKVVKEIGSGLNDNRQQLAKIIVDPNYNVLIVEHKDRLARFGTNYLEILLKELDKKVEIVNQSEDKQDELMEDLIAVDDYLHKASRYLVNLLVEQQITTLVIGNNEGWKQEVNLGKVNNQKFVTIPHSRLIDMITYKCQLVGIKVIIQEESYTSASNFLNLDPIPVYGEITEKPIFSGKRIKRGLYRTDNGFLCQSDVNGSYNILRKAFPNAFTRYGIERCVVHPRRINLSK